MVLEAAALGRQPLKDGLSILPGTSGGPVDDLHSVLGKMPLELGHVPGAGIASAVVAVKGLLEHCVCPGLVQGQLSSCLKLMHDLCQVEEEACGEAVVVPLGFEMQRSEVLHYQRITFGPMQN